jgi:SPASM domain peptide maturase of grasp-with-spasm system
MRHFNLFSNIFLFKGITRVLICDLQRNTSELYPIEYGILIEDLKNKPIDSISDEFDIESKIFFDEFLNNLLQKEYGFITENGWDLNFPAMNTVFENPSTISNLFIEFDKLELLHDLKSSIDILDINFILIFSERNIQVEEFLQIDKIFGSSCLFGIEIYSPFHFEVNKTALNYINKNARRIYNLVFYNCKKKPIFYKENLRFSLEFTNKKLVRASCGIVDLKYFNTNLPKVLESLNHNSCLNKKISIDKDGNIKNCPSMPQSFGNIKDTTLEEAVNHKDFKKYWNVNKDMIAVCKDCEFRHICTDCRAYTERTHFEEDIDLSKPLKCGYNPYTNEWAEWSTNPLKQKAIEYYGMQDLVKKDA